MTSPPGAATAETDLDAGQPGWSRTLYAVWFGEILALVGFSSRVPFLPFFLGDLGVTDVAGQTLWSGAINAAGAAALAITSPLWGILADRYGRKPMLMRGLFGGAICVTLMGFATAPWQLLALRVFEGSMTGTVAAAAALVATSAPRRRMGYALGMVQTAVFAGASLRGTVGTAGGAGIVPPRGMSLSPTPWYGSGQTSSQRCHCVWK